MSEEKSGQEEDSVGSETVNKGSGCLQVVLASAILAISIPLILAGADSPKGLYFGGYWTGNFEKVYDSLIAYAEANDGNYPQDNWFEVLYPNGDFEQYGLSKYSAVILNPEALRLSVNAPDDMVLGYGSYEEDCWGTVGIYDPEVHGKRKMFMPCLFCDGSVKRISVSHIKYLRWKEEGYEIPVLNTSGVVGVMSGVVIVVLGIVFVCFKSFVKHSLTIFTILIMALLPGIYFGDMGSRLYLSFLGFSFEQYKWVTYFLGPVVAIGYVPLMGHLRANTNVFKNTGTIILCGIATGVICSCVTHIILRYIFLEQSYKPMIAGVPFGAWSGAALGWLTSAMISSKDIGKQEGGRNE